jgi:hypothetical protein
MSFSFDLKSLNSNQLLELISSATKMYAAKMTAPIEILDSDSESDEVVEIVQPVKPVLLIPPVQAKRFIWESYVANLGIANNHPMTFKPAGSFFKQKPSIPCYVAIENGIPTALSKLYKSSIVSNNPTGLGASIKKQMGAPASKAASARGYPICNGHEEFFISYNGTDYKLSHPIWNDLRWDIETHSFVSRI